MKTSIAFFCALCLAGSVSAQGVYNMAKQQAKNAAGSDSSTGQPATAHPAPPAPPANPSPSPALEATLQNIENLRYDFEKFDSNPTNTQPLINDLTAAAQNTKPSPDSISRLAGDLATAISGKDKLRAPEKKLAREIHAIFNSSHLSPSQQQMIFDDVQKILQDGGVSSGETDNVINELKTIAKETK